jgi:hypothetical protein
MPAGVGRVGVRVIGHQPPWQDKLSNASVACSTWVDACRGGKGGKGWCCGAGLVTEAQHVTSLLRAPSVAL